MGARQSRGRLLGGRRTRRDMVGRSKRYAVADTAQQLVGGFLLAGPFVVTEEVWELAANMGPIHVAATVGIVFAIGYAALYKADAGRDPEREMEVAGVPVRFISLMAVAYGSVLLLALAFSAPDTFVTDGTDIARAATTVKAASIGAVFSVIGAATADSIY
ncbi:MAG: DUF2391 family protein [Halobacteriales archaeon]|nr:DUF2391 family protein [Halobacteriales archaeon]